MRLACTAPPSGSGDARARGRLGLEGGCAPAGSGAGAPTRSSAGPRRPLAASITERGGRPGAGVGGGGRWWQKDQVRACFPSLGHLARGKSTRIALL